MNAATSGQDTEEVSHRFFSRGTEKSVYLEKSLLPLLESIIVRYPPSLTFLSVMIELFQCLGFALNPHYPGNYLAYSLIYYFQLPFWDGEFQLLGFPSFKVFTILYIIIASIVGILSLIFCAGLVWTSAVVEKCIKKLRFAQLFNCFTSILFIPVIQTLLSGYICKKKPNISVAERTTYNFDPAKAFSPHIVFFPDQPCNESRSKAIMGVSIVLLAFWGCISYLIQASLLPVDREDPSVRRRSSALLDNILFVYKIGLCVTFQLTEAYSVHATRMLVVALSSLIVSFAFAFTLPFYARWMNQLYCCAFMVISWGAFTEFIAYCDPTENFLTHGTIYFVLCIPGVVLGFIAWHLGAFRYNPIVDKLLKSSTDKKFVSVDQNPFVVVFLQNNYDQLPFPKGIPTTDALFSPYYATSVEILEEMLREEEIMRTQATNEEEVKVPEDGCRQEEKEEERLAKVLGMEQEWNGVNIIAEASRRQVVVPSLTRICIPSDVEASIRFLYDWQDKTETFPSPHMVCFASRIFNRALLRWPCSSEVTLAYIGFICDCAPSLNRMSSCLELLNYMSREYPNRITETFLIYHFGVHLKATLGIRSEIHQDLFNKATEYHRETLLHSTLLWRSLQEDKRNIVTLYWFASDLTDARWKCFNAYDKAVTTIKDDEVLVQNMGVFFETVYKFKQLSFLCRTVATSLAQMSLFRFQRAFQTTEVDLDGDHEAEKKVQKEDNDSYASSSHLSSAMSGSRTGSSNASSRVSSLSSGGRSSQSRSRNAKRVAELMIERLLDVRQENYKKLKEHLSWNGFRFGTIFAWGLICAVMVANFVVTMVRFQEWDSLMDILAILSDARVIINLLIVHLHYIDEMLPSETYLLSTSDIENIRSNATYLRAAVNAAESITSSVLYGENALKQNDVLAEISRPRNFVRVYTSTENYIEYIVSFITHVASVYATARRVADFVDTLPTKAAFRANPDTTMLTHNVLITLHSSFTELEDDISTRLSSISIHSVLTFIILAIASVLAIAFACYVILWNYRRAASVIASEMRLFFIIPSQSIARLTTNAQKDIDSFSEQGEKSNLLASILKDERKDVSRASLLQSFGRRDSHAVTSTLLSHLLNRYNTSEHSQVSDNEESRGKPGKAGSEEDEEASVSQGSVEPLASAEPVGRAQVISVDPNVEYRVVAEQPFSSKKPTEFVNVYAKKKPPNTFTLFNDFYYPEIQDNEEKNNDLDDGIEQLFVSSQLKDESDVSFENFTWKRIIAVTIVTIVLFILGVVFLVISMFSISSLTVIRNNYVRKMECAEDLSSSTGKMVLEASRFIALGSYGTYLQFQEAILSTEDVFRECRNAIEDSSFFFIRESFVSNLLISMSLRVKALNAGSSDPQAPYAYPLVLDYSWAKPSKTATIVGYLSKFLTPKELAAWVPYSSSVEDFAKTAAEMAEISIQTFFGPVGRAYLQSMGAENEELLKDLVSAIDEGLTGGAHKVNRDLILTIAFFGAAALFSLCHFLTSSRKRKALIVFWSLYGVFCLAIVAICICGVMYCNKIVKDLVYWARGVASLKERNFEFVEIIFGFLGYPIAPNDITLNLLMESFSDEKLILFDQPFIPQPGSIFSNLDMKYYYEMVDARNLFYHYSWLSIVCSVVVNAKNGLTSVFINSPLLVDTRWDMSTDKFYNDFKELYPSDTYLTTYATDTATTALPLCQGSLFGEFTSRRIDSWYAAQQAAGEYFDDELESLNLKNINRLLLCLYLSFAFCGLAALCLGVLLAILTSYSIRAFSRTNEERMVYRAGFYSDGLKVVGIGGLLAGGVLMSCGVALFFSISVKTSMIVGLTVMKIRWVVSFLSAYGASLASSANFFEFTKLNTFFSQYLDEINAVLENSYLANDEAVRLSISRFSAIFGSDEPFADFSTVNSESINSRSCVDPTNPDTGNSQPITIQLGNVVDFLRIINSLPIEIIATQNLLENIVLENYFTISPVLYYIINGGNPLVKIRERSNLLRTICILLLVATMFLTLLFYFCLLSKIVVRTQQQSIGTKLLLLGLPDDILNTVPEIKEFYDPEAGSSDDQLKRKLLQSERLLQNILPPNISRRLKNGERVIADAHTSVTVVFAALVGFDEYSNMFDANGLVLFLNGIVVAFDHIVDLLDLEKVKTIADVYFFCGGLTKKTERDHPVRCVECSLFFFQALEDHNSRHNTPNIQLRVGINTDAAVAGVIGNKKVAYDLWGDCVNTASRMYSTGVPGRIQISHNTYERVSSYYTFEDRHVQAKGKGMLLTHLYVDRLKNTNYTDLNWRVVT